MDLLSYISGILSGISIGGSIVLYIVWIVERKYNKEDFK